MAVLCAVLMRFLSLSLSLAGGTCGPHYKTARDRHPLQCQWVGGILLGLRLRGRKDSSKERKVGGGDRIKRGHARTSRGVFSGITSSGRICISSQASNGLPSSAFLQHR